MRIPADPATAFDAPSTQTDEGAKTGSSGPTPFAALFGQMGGGLSSNPGISPQEKTVNNTGAIGLVTQGGGEPTKAVPTPIEIAGAGKPSPSLPPLDAADRAIAEQQTPLEWRPETAVWSKGQSEPKAPAQKKSQADRAEKRRRQDLPDIHSSLEAAALLANAPPITPPAVLKIGLLGDGAPSSKAETTPNSPMIELKLAAFEGGATAGARTVGLSVSGEATTSSQVTFGPPGLRLAGATALRTAAQHAASVPVDAKVGAEKAEPDAHETSADANPSADAESPTPSTETRHESNASGQPSQSDQQASPREDARPDTQSVAEPSVPKETLVHSKDANDSPATVRRLTVNDPAHVRTAVATDANVPLMSRPVDRTGSAQVVVKAIVDQVQDPRSHRANEAQELEVHTRSGDVTIKVEVEGKTIRVQLGAGAELETAIRRHLPELQTRLSAMGFRLHDVTFDQARAASRPGQGTEMDPGGGSYDPSARQQADDSADDFAGPAVPAAANQSKTAPAATPAKAVRPGKVHILA